MSITTGVANLAGFAECVPAILQTRAEERREVYERNRHRIYSWAFWMTDHELAAEDLMIACFCRAFANSDAPSADDIDSALIAELRQCMVLGTLTLRCTPNERVSSLRRNVLRVELERALVQLPETERLIFLMHDVEGYDHARVSRLLNVAESESQQGVYQARLRLRELLAQ